MFDKIILSIQKNGRFSEQEISFLTDRLVGKTLQQNAFLLKEGQVCAALYFVKTGALKQYYFNDDHLEVTHNFYLENDWVLDIESFLAQKPTRYNIQTSEETEVFEISIQSMHELIALSQKFLQMLKILDFCIRDARYDTLISPEEKYRHLMDTKPQFIKKFPLKHIASYLKMTPETLSRVRRKINQV